MEWISVKDRLPEDEMWVITGSVGHVFVGRYYAYSKQFACNDVIFKNVTHWMPLPQPPQD